MRPLASRRPARAWRALRSVSGADRVARRAMVCSSVAKPRNAALFQLRPGCAAMQGYIQDAGDELRVPLLADLAAPGALFDPRTAGQALKLVPVLCHVAVIFVLNQVLYRRVAAWLTANENHRSEEAHEASMVVKRFLFEACDCYLALVYLAFWQLDALKLRAELRALFTADCIRRLVTEVLIPWALQRGSAALGRPKVVRAPLQARALGVHAMWLILSRGNRGRVSAPPNTAYSPCKPAISYCRRKREQDQAGRRSSCATWQGTSTRTLTTTSR